MNVTINGDLTMMTVGSTVADAASAAGQVGDRFGIAIAVNGEVVPRSQWHETMLSEGDRVEVLVAAQGG